MACEVKLKWIEEMIPLLKNVDLAFLSTVKAGADGIKKRLTSEPNEDAKKDEPESEEQIKKREAEKLQAAKERYLKRKKLDQ